MTAGDKRRKIITANFAHSCVVLAGSIPPELGKLAALQSLNLWSNELTGETYSRKFQLNPRRRSTISPAYGVCLCAGARAGFMHIQNPKKETF